jgi:hypothetical protein
MQIGGLLIGMTDAQGHGFVIAATHNLERQRQQSDRRGNIWRRQGAHLQQIAKARETRRLGRLTPFMRGSDTGAAQALFQSRRDSTFLLLTRVLSSWTGHQQHNHIGVERIILNEFAARLDNVTHHGEIEFCCGSCTELAQQ